MMPLSEAFNHYLLGRGIIADRVSNKPLEVVKDGLSTNLYIIIQNSGSIHISGEWEVKFAWFDFADQVRWYMEQINFPGAHSFELFEDGRLARIAWELGEDTYAWYPKTYYTMTQIIDVMKIQCRKPEPQYKTTWKEPTDETR